MVFRIVLRPMRIVEQGNNHVIMVTERSGVQHPTISMHCLVLHNVLRLAKVKLIGHPQIFVILYYVGRLRHQRW